MHALRWEGHAGDVRMRFLGQVVLIFLLCASGAWILAALLAFAWNVQPVDFNSRFITFLSWIVPRPRYAKR